MTVQPVAHSLRAVGADASEDGTGRGTPLVVGAIAPTLRVGGRDQGAGNSHDNTPCVVQPQVTYAIGCHAGAAEAEVSNAAHASGGATSFGIGEEVGNSVRAGRVSLIAPVYASVENLGVRMLTPLECERIMSWPDDWTRWGIDEKGRQYELKDSPRYQLCGNGEAKDWGEWIARRLMMLEAA